MLNAHTHDWLLTVTLFVNKFLILVWQMFSNNFELIIKKYEEKENILKAKLQLL